MACVDFTRSLVETIRSSEFQKGEVMEEFEQVETVDESIDKLDETCSCDETNSGSGIALTVGAGLAGIAGTLAWKKFSPSVKEWAHKRKVIKLEKKVSRAAEDQIKAQAELEKLRSKETEEK